MKLMDIQKDRIADMKLIDSPKRYDIRLILEISNTAYRLK